MSKKLIAIASAAALAISALVAAPASATAITNVTIWSGTATAGVANTASHTNSDSALAAATFAGARNVIFDTVTNAATRTALRFDVNTAAAASAINVTSTGGVKIASVITAAGSAIKVDAGSQALNGATVAGALTYTFYAWNTSTTAGSVVIDSGTSKYTFYVKGIKGEAYNIIDAVFPTSLPQSSTTNKVNFKLTDAYGNLLDTNSAFTPTISALGATATAPGYSATTKLWSSTISVGAASTNVSLQLNIFPIDLSDSGFAKPVNVAFNTVTAGNLAAQVTALTAQVAALQATVAASRTKARSVTKKKYNTLARKWNAQNRTARVALKK